MKNVRSGDYVMICVHIPMSRSGFFDYQGPVYWWSSQGKGDWMRSLEGEEVEISHYAVCAECHKEFVAKRGQHEQGEGMRGTVVMWLGEPPEGLMVQ